MAAQIARMSDGNFLYASVVLSAITQADLHQRLELNLLGNLPDDLGGIYHKMFRQRFRGEEQMDRYARRIRPLLECLEGRLVFLLGDLVGGFGAIKFQARDNPVPKQLCGAFKFRSGIHELGVGCPPLGLQTKSLFWARACPQSLKICPRPVKLAL